MPRLPKNLQISFEKSPPPRPESPELVLSPARETVVMEDPDLDALDDMVPQFVEKDPPVESDIFAPAQPRKPPSIRKVVEEPPPLPKKAPKLTKTGKVRKEMSEEQKQKARDNLKRARELRASRLKAQAPPPPETRTRACVCGTPRASTRTSTRTRPSTRTCTLTRPRDLPSRPEAI